MNQIVIFENKEFGKVRTVTIDNEPWFVGKDVADALGYANTRKALIDHIEIEDKGVTKCDTPGGEQDMVIINESGMYALIFGSKLESAKRFKHWVTSEVLPSIRKTGAYQIPLTTEGQIRLLAQGQTELVERIDSVNRDLQDFKKDLPLLAIECQRITRAKNQKVVPLMGGRNSAAYKDNSLRGKVYSDVDGQLRREFGVDSYKAIRRNQCDLAIKIIENYELPMSLAEQIKDANAQMTF